MENGYRPQWKGVFQAYARKYAAANHRRVRFYCDDIEDTVQQCAMVFCYLSKIYEDKVENDAWFMALYKTALVNAFHNMSRESRKRERVLAAIEAMEPLPDIDHPAGLLWTALTEASDELQLVLQTIATAPSELLQLLLPDRPVEDEASLSRSWCRFARTAEVRDDLLDELRMRI